MLDTRYDPRAVEGKIYELWEKSGYFNPDNLSARKTKNLKLKTSAKGGSPPKADAPREHASGGKNFIVYMPLPNVTGSLHMGHALDNVTPDILIRYKRMKGFRTLWLPGTDHAGIATQYVVEKQLKKEGTSRFDLGREKFIARVWEWKKEYGGKILEQLKKLGVSADWSRARFTMDPAYAADVMKAFIHYHKKGWIYRGFRTVNWCPRCGTSLSELELEYREEKTTLYYMKYGPFTLATTRPETKFGDTALAVNPKDARYKRYIGQTLEADSLATDGSLDVPRLKKVKLLVIGDEAVDMAFGTGVVKVTPAHDLVDFEMGVRHKLPTVQVIDERGRMNERVGKYAGMKTSDARKKVAEDMRATGLMVKEEPYDHRVAVCYRCGTIIEPIPSQQWFLKMEKLAEAALAAVKTKKVTITPKNFERPYRDWLTSIRDWTISRQIWWGHQLPVFFCRKKLEAISNNQFLISKQKGERFVVALERPQTCPFCKHCDMEQSPDVLDTWFSSALWPFAGLSEEDKKKYYPGDLVSNAREILNLWDARMIFSGLEFMGKVPFKNILIHGTVLTKEGKRMSKSLGTGADPLEYIEQFGADATRFAVVWQATGQDIRWDEAAAVAGKKFCNKLWNAARFVITHTPAEVFMAKACPRGGTAADKAILKKLAAVAAHTEKHIQMFAFSKALRGLYDFFWHEFCDVYVEQSKKQLADVKLKKGTEAVLAHVLISSLKLLHPFLPFVTEEIYQKLPRRAAGGLLIIVPW